METNNFDSLLHILDQKCESKDIPNYQFKQVSDTTAYLQLGNIASLKVIKRKSCYKMQVILSKLDIHSKRKLPHTFKVYPWFRLYPCMWYSRFLSVMDKVKETHNMGYIITLNEVLEVLSKNKFDSRKFVDEVNADLSYVYIKPTSNILSFSVVNSKEEIGIITVRDLSKLNVGINTNFNNLGEVMAVAGAIRKHYEALPKNIYFGE